MPEPNDERSLLIIHQTLVQLTTRMEFFTERIIAMEAKLDTHYATKESVKNISDRLHKVEESYTWMSRGVIGAMITAGVTLLMKLGKLV